MSFRDARLVDTKTIVDALLKKNRDCERTSGPDKNNHVPMTLIALYRLGGSPEQMHRYVESFDRMESTPKIDNAGAETITPDNWKDQLGQGRFPLYVEFFDGWVQRTSIETVLKESVPVLMKGVASAAYHALLRLAYALDYGSREEVVSSLAYWASDFYPGPDFDPDSKSVEPDVFFADIVERASTLHIEETPSIDSRIHQVYESTELKGLWKPIVVQDSNCLERMSELVREIFAESQHFTLLHAVTSCQALRLVLPYIGDRRKNLSMYWHSVCAAYLTVCRGRFEVGKDMTPVPNLAWEEVFRRAADREVSLEHTVKLAYTCWLESRNYGRSEYLALASRELTKPSPFV